jgi:hypothetical protein
LNDDARDDEGRPFDLARRRRDVEQLAAATTAVPPHDAPRVLVVELVTRTYAGRRAVYTREAFSWRDGERPAPAPTPPAPVAGTTHLLGAARDEVARALPAVLKRGGTAFGVKEAFDDWGAEALVLTYFDGRAWGADSWFYLARAVEDRRGSLSPEVRDLYAVLRALSREARRYSPMTDHYGKSLED